MHKNAKDITGMRFSNLVAIRCVGRKTKSRVLFWECICDCGKTVIVDGTELRNFKKTHCGCKKEPRLKANHKNRLFRIWWGMKLRCEYPTKPEYKHYGAKGIKICPEWQIFQNFATWAISHGYNDNLTIDRIDVKKDYYPENCQWLTWDENHKKGIAQRDYSKFGTHHITKTKFYHLFQGRKKDMCQEWQDVTIFKKWADEHGYKEGLCLIRLDYSKPISPTNCKFGTRAEKVKVIKENKERLGIGILCPDLKEYRKNRTKENYDDPIPR